MKASVLIVDDETRMLELLSMILEPEFSVTVTSCSREALHLFRSRSFDLCLLDIMMPGMEGRELLRQLRKEQTDLPVIFLSARSDLEDRVEGLELGADDYITKPFEPMELVARIHAVLRRTRKRGQKQEGLANGLHIDWARREVWHGGEEIKLTPIEFDLLRTLAQHPKQAFPREQLLEKVWGFDYYGDARTVDTHIKNLRTKLRQAGLREEVIQTVWGFGYKWGVM
ncbi:two-component system response regulator ResD [Laceyella sacchari]|uniref:response regulator transcription factor n=1 Tax=Laceyella sacchari TaxID=37482 RepID=UPI00104CB5AF|nr:response regulator transcription factor [Laceyella sacchari]TCW40684.1 two-component system response regulator ResD [Laceyella sacchari]